MLTQHSFTSTFARSEEEEAKIAPCQTKTNAVRMLHSIRKLKIARTNQLTNTKFLIQINISFVTCICRVAPTKFPFKWHTQHICSQQMKCIAKTLNENHFDLVPKQCAAGYLSNDVYGANFKCKFISHSIHTIIRLKCTNSCVSSLLKAL